MLRRQGSALSVCLSSLTSGLASQVYDASQCRFMNVNEIIRSVNALRKRRLSCYQCSGSKAGTDFYRVHFYLVLCLRDSNITKLVGC